jgi:hypothetical protein
MNMGATPPEIDLGNFVSGVTNGVSDGVSENMTAVGVLAGSLMAIGVVWGLVRRAARSK